MRLEKGYGSWTREYRPIYTPAEAGMDRLVRMDKGEFIGRDALLRPSNQPKMRLAHFTVEAEEADAFGDEAILLDGKVAGWVTSGGYSPTANMSVAIGYVYDAIADAVDGYAIEIVGAPRKARRLARPLFDPESVRLRA